MKIWYQSALAFEDQALYRDSLTRGFGRSCSPGTEVVLRGRGFAAKGLPNSDVIGSPAAYFRIVAPVFLDAVSQAQREGYDAFVIGTFSEPIVAELRSLATIPVITMPESAMFLACTVARKFALVTISRIAAEPFLPRTVATHGLSGRLSGIHVVDEKTTEEQVHSYFANPGPYMERFKAACRIAIASGAEAIVPAEGMLAAMVAENGIFEVDGAPVMDSISAPILYAEMAVRLRESIGLQQSRIAYPRPSTAALRLFFGEGC